MQGIEKSHLDAVILAVLQGYYSFLDASVKDALAPITGKKFKSDTLGLDFIPESMILKSLLNYDHQSLVITEEVGSREDFHYITSNDPRTFKTVFIGDPTDRSKQIKQSLEAAENREQTVSEVFSRQEFKKEWEEKFGAPVSITGGTSAVTCVRKGVPIFAVIVNYITNQLFVACSAGCYAYKITPDNFDGINIDMIIKKGEKIFFSNNCSTSDAKKFVTFMGKSGYKENFLDSYFMPESDLVNNMHYNECGGPSRVLYLSNLQPKAKPIGFVLANGEKITEWIHWLPFVRFAHPEHDQGESALNLYEVSQDRPHVKEGILMSTSPVYSIFKSIDNGKMVIDVPKFATLPNASHVRSTLMLAPSDNSWVSQIAEKYDYRRIVL